MPFCQRCFQMSRCALSRVKDRSLWIGMACDGGIARIRGGTVESFDAPTLVPLRCSSEDANGAMWREVVAGYSVCRWPVVQSRAGLAGGCHLERLCRALGAMFVAGMSGIFRKGEGQSAFVQVERLKPND